jgi:L-fuconolactonase
MTYDLLIHPKHLGAATELVRRFPDQPFVLDHLAKPPIRDGRLSPWREGIRELAAHPNVMCKVSGMVTEARWGGWGAADFEPYLDTVFEAFGEDRLMFGSDWPVCVLSGTYAQVTGLVRDYTAQGSESARSKLFAGNAEAFYRLQ